MKRAMTVVAAAALMLSLLLCSGCAGAQDAGAPSEASAYEDATYDDFYQALYQVAVMLPTETAIEGIDFSTDMEAKEVHASFETTASGDDLRAIADEAEAVCRMYSCAVAQIMQARYEAEGDEEKARSLDELVSSEEANAGDADTEAQASSAGALYDTYKAIVVVTSEDGEVSIDGERDAGADSEWRWQ